MGFGHITAMAIGTNGELYRLLKAYLNVHEVIASLVELHRHVYG